MTPSEYNDFFDDGTWPLTLPGETEVKHDYYIRLLEKFEEKYPDIVDLGQNGAEPVNVTGTAKKLTVTIRFDNDSEEIEAYTVQLIGTIKGQGTHRYFAATSFQIVGAKDSEGNPVTEWATAHNHRFQ